MAEFALGLTKTAVEGTLSLVKKAIEDEAELKVKVQNDLVFITGEFEMMQSFLRVANKERAKNEVVRTWVRQVRTLAFDVEDYVEFVIHLDNKSKWGWLRRLWQMVHCRAPPLPLDEAVAEVKRLKARVEDVSQRNTRYNLIGDSGSNLRRHVSADAKEEQLLTSPNETASAFHLLSEVWKDSGKWSGMRDLEKLIINSEGQDLQVISVWGCGGADQTTSIFFKAYGDEEICQRFKRRAWVKLVHPFSPSEFLNNLLTQFYTTSHQANEILQSRAAPLPLDELVEKVKEHKYLILLEDVSSVVEWDAIKMHLPDSNNGSRIVVSTKQLGLALLCTGDPYQVSDLGRFSQPLCAISKQIRRRSGQLMRQLICRGVISVLGCASDNMNSTILHKVYTSIMQKSKQLEGMEFKRYIWVDMPTPFNLEAFSRRLLMNFRSEDQLHRVEEIAVVEMMRDQILLTQECCKFLHEEDCLVVIDGLQSTCDWDMIKAAFLSKPTRGCVVVVTKEKNVATYCVDGEDRALSIEDLIVDRVLVSMIKGCRCHGIGSWEDSPMDLLSYWEDSLRGLFLSIRRENARELVEYNRAYYLDERYYEVLHHPVTSIWGTDSECMTKSDIIRALFYYQIYYSVWACDKHDTHSTCQKGKEFTMFSWVDVHHPFNLTDFSRRLLLDFHSDDLQAKRSVAVDIMEGRQDPIQECRKFLCQCKCFVVIDGLLTEDEWDSIKEAFLSEPTEGCIIVITNEASLARYVVSEECQSFNVEYFDECEFFDFEPETVDCSLREGCVPRRLPIRIQEARDWIRTVVLVGSQAESIFNLRYISSGVTTVWGIAGVGKSTLVRTLYFHFLLRAPRRLLDFGADVLGTIDPRRYGITMYGWVDVPCPFSLTELCRRLLLDFLSDDLQAKEAAAVGIVEGHDPIQGCRRIMRQHICFIVIDGLRSTDDWDLIKAAFQITNGTLSIVVVITNEESVAQYCVAGNKYNVHNVKGLEAGSALSLFNKITRGCKDLSCDEKEISKCVISKCGGILKVIAAMGKFVAKDVITLPISYLMDRIDNEFMGMLERDTEFHSLRGLFAWMQAYFDDCSDSLKPCIFYMSIFPANQDIRRRRLLRRWITEGYCKDISDEVREENGNGLFDELVRLSIIQLKGEIKAVCQLNGFFHEYIISRPIEDNLIFALEGRCSLNSEHTGQHLTIRSSWVRDEIVFRDMDFSRLRSLTVFGEWKSFLISEKMTLLRVLDLEDASRTIENGDLEHIGKLMPRLKFLSLRGHIEISCLPDSFGSLRQLQTLDVRHTSVVTLPPGIIKLHKLQYVRAGTKLTSDEVDVTATSLPIEDVEQTSVPLEDVNDMARVQTSTTVRSRPRTLVSSWFFKLRKRRLGNGGVKVPARIGSLTALHTLGVVNVHVASGKAILKEIKKLTQLRRLGISGVNRECWQEFCSSISGHGHLESLSVKVVEDREGLVARSGDISQPLKALRCLKVYGNVQILPAWTFQLTKVYMGNYSLTIFTQQDINDLFDERSSGGIDRLYIKPIQDCDELYVGMPQEIYCSGQYFICNIFEIECTSKLSITFGNMPKLVEVLKVHCSSGSSLQIYGLKELHELKEVWLKGSNVDELEQDLQRQINEHANKPVLKLVEPRSS